jgi:hypothetical protein
MTSKHAATIVLSLVIPFAFQSILEAQCTIRVLDTKKNGVQFILTNSDRPSDNFKSDSMGELVITNVQRQKYRDTRFTFGLTESLASFIYEPRLQNIEGKFANANGDNKYTFNELCASGSTTSANIWIVPDLKRGLKY